MPQRPMPHAKKSEALDAQEAAALLNAHVETVRRLARRGEIPSFKLGKDWRFDEKALLRWIESASENERKEQKLGARAEAAHDKQAA